MARWKTHTLSHKHLAVLQWFHFFAVTEERPEGWVKESRVMKGMRIDPATHMLALVKDPKTGAIDVNRRLLITACGEELHDLRVKLNSDDPFLVTHPSAPRYRISKAGRKLARTCTVIMRTIEDANGPRGIPQVVLTATGKPPIIQSTENVPLIDDDDDDDDDDMPVINTGVDMDQDVTQAAEGPASMEGEGDEDGDDQTEGADEINNPRSIATPPRRPQTHQVPTPPKRPAMAMQAPKPKPRPKHTRATVPGRE